ncbi:MAG TPA: ATP-binding protein [Rhodocyclaceae bacterium]|nr:ATP-binding protein [Rhodocyclaceae bacterium]
MAKATSSASTTGTENRADRASAPGLVRSLFRVSLPRWRGGRYSLSKLFFNFYLLAMGSFVAIAFTADFVISTAQRGITDDYARRFMHGTITLIEEELFRHPRSHWDKEIKDLDSKFSYKLDIVERMTLDRVLTPTQVLKLDGGEIAIDHDGEVMYHRLRNTSQVLVVGPLAANRNQEITERGIPLDLRLRLLTWSLIGVIFGVALWFWVWPVWRDLEALRQTARALGDGHFDSRSPAARSQLFAPLADTLNGMADRIQQLIATHKELSSGISHELRTPIARLRFALEMLAETEEREERERLWAMMETDLDELDNLIDSSLTYARFEREAPAPHFTSVRFAAWLQEEIDSVRLLGRQLEISVDASSLPEGLAIDLDRKAMPYAIRNLLRNAIKYASKRIAITAEMRDGQIMIHVDDDGIGIPPEEREHIFSAFTRLDRSRDRSTGGYGLGLAIARRVMELHDGTANADASPILGGARFTLSWPAHQ